MTTFRTILVVLFFSLPIGVQSDEIEDARAQLIAGLERCVLAIRAASPEPFSDLEGGYQNDSRDRFSKGQWRSDDGAWEFRLKAYRPHKVLGCSVKRAGSGAVGDVDRTLIRLLDNADEITLSGARFTVLIDRQGTLGRIRVHHSCDVRQESVALYPDFAQTSGRVRFSMSRNLFEKDAC